MIVMRTWSTAGSMPAMPGCEQTGMLVVFRSQPTAAPPRKARRTGAAGHAAVLCSKCAPETMMAGARPALGKRKRKSTGMMNRRSCLPAGAHRLADGEVVRGDVKNAEMLANGNPSQVVTRPSNVNHLRQPRGLGRPMRPARRLTPAVFGRGLAQMVCSHRDSVEFRCLQCVHEF